MDFWGIVIYALLVFYFLLVIATVFTVLHERRDPVRALSWIAVIVLLPFAGMVLFVFFGQDYRKQKIFNRKEIKDLIQFEQLSYKQLREIDTFSNPEVAANREIITLLLNNNKSLLTTNNRLEVLNDGSETFASLIDALRKAESFIHLEYYIFENDELGGRIADILKEKARSGVEVRFIYDDVGSWNLKRSFIRSLREAGVQVHCFMPVVFPWLTSKINYRNHRKIVVIDGKVGYTGGLNIADRYLRGTKHGPWRDTHLKIEGTAVNMLQLTFLADWYFATGIQLKDKDKYLMVSDDSVGDTAVQVATSGPDSDWATIMQAYFAAITKATDHIYISTPYFMPGESLLTALKVAALSGIDVRIMLPSRSDSKIVYWASRSYIAELLEAKIKVYLYNKGFNHSKIITIDNRFSSIGTANMDNRSFEDNFEVTAMIYDRNMTDRLESRFLADLDGCTRLTYRRWATRSRTDMFKESVARLFSPLL
ncbi:cardiolipin synthase [Millionella massiliensis]|uniref:cardiolipin synthase n=1 Tax=Millionella massiliensis TaxID=1871023 RepID=UPI0008D8E08A|nr:cardiolipin synthase [Millionella massiliensis]